MKSKTIKAILNKKLNEWIETIKDDNVKSLAKANTIVTGGCIPSMLMNEKPNDFDIYFKNKETVKAVAQYYANKWNEVHGVTTNNIGNKENVYVLDGAEVEEWKQGKKTLLEIAPNYNINIPFDKDSTGVSHMITNTTEDRIKVIYPSQGIISEEPATQPSMEEMIESADTLYTTESEINEEALNSLPEEVVKEKYRPIFLTTNAISLSNKMQMIIRFYGEPSEIHANYDFIHCCCYFDFSKNELVTPEESLLAIMNKDLMYRGSKYPICSMIRTRKFIKRGWNINAGQFVKIAFQISELNLNDIDILEDQLVGVDTVYFLQLIRALRKMKENDANFTYDTNYITTIIDKIF